MDIEEIELLRDSKVPLQKIKGLRGGKRGYSAQNISHQRVEHGNNLVEELNSRPLDDEPIVAAYLDGTAIGDKSVMIVVGVTAYGRKVALGAAVTPWEKAKDILPLFEKIVARGVDPGILWIADHGSGIESALKQLTGSRPPNLQVCTIHAARNFRDALRNTTDFETKAWVDKIYDAWDEDDYDVAKGKLETVLDELKAAGQGPAWRSLKKNYLGTITVQKLGFVGKLRRQLRQTNSQESINSAIKNGSRPPPTWEPDPERPGDPRLRAAAWGLRMLAKNDAWTRLTEPRQLVQRLRHLISRRHDPEAILDSLPPDVAVYQSRVSLADDAKAREKADRWLGANPNAIWVGDTRTLAALGLDTRDRPTAEALTEALRLRNSGMKVRVHKIPQGAKEIVTGKWELRAPSAVVRKWHQGGRARKEAERWLAEAGFAAAAALTKTTSEHDGFAGVMALRRPPEQEPDQPLSVVGIAFAVQRGKGAAVQPADTDKMFKPKRERDAEIAAQVVFEQRLGQERERITTARDAIAAPPSPELKAGVGAWAMTLAPDMVAASDERLKELTNTQSEAAAENGLQMMAGEVHTWIAERWNDAIRQVAAAREQPLPPGTISRGVWYPLSEEQRLMLGERRTEQLLINAAKLQGRAQVDAGTAKELREVTGNPLAELDRAGLAHLSRAAEVDAAGHELERRRKIENAINGEGHAPASLLHLRDRYGHIIDPPVERFENPLGPRAEALRQSAQAYAADLAKPEMHPAALRRLLTETSEAFKQLRPGPAKILNEVETESHDVLVRELRAAEALGHAEAMTEVTAARMDNDALKEAEHAAKRAKASGRGCWEKRRRLEAELEKYRTAEGSPDRLLRDPDAALHQAVYVELANREQGIERGWVPEPEIRPKEPAGIEF